MFYISMFLPGFVGFLLKGQHDSERSALVNKSESQKQKCNSFTHESHGSRGKTILPHE